MSAEVKIKNDTGGYTMAVHVGQDVQFIPSGESLAISCADYNNAVLYVLCRNGELRKVEKARIK